MSWEGFLPSSVHRKNLNRSWYALFLKFAVEFPSEVIWAWSFLCGKALNYSFNLFNGYWFIHTISS